MHGGLYAIRLFRAGGLWYYTHIMKTEAFAVVAFLSVAALAAPLPKGAEPAQQEVRHLDLFRQTLTLTDTQFAVEMRRIASAYPSLAKLTSLGRSQEGREVLMLTVTDFADGGEEKPGYFIQGHLHSKEMSGSVAGLHIALRLLEEHRSGDVLSKVVFYIVPRCNPDGADRMAHLPSNERSGWGPFSDRANVYEPYDINGDGHIDQMLIPLEDGKWMRDPADPRGLIRRTPEAKGPFYGIHEEGMLRNWDGKYRGGGVDWWRPWIDMNRNWSYGWSAKQYGGGPAPLFYPEVRMQADFLETHRNIRGAMCLHNGWGMVMVHDVEEADSERLMRLARRGEELIGYPVVNEKMRPKSETQAVQSGLFSEYCYRRLGMLCFTIELGTRETSAGLDVLTAKEKPYAYTAPYEVMAHQDAHPELPKCWFDWKKFNHPQLGEVEIGGICATYFASPLPEHLARVSEGTYKFAVECALEAASDGKPTRD